MPLSILAKAPKPTNIVAVPRAKAFSNPYCTHGFQIRAPHASSPSFSRYHRRSLAENRAGNATNSMGLPMGGAQKVQIHQPRRHLYHQSPTTLPLPMRSFSLAAAARACVALLPIVAASVTQPTIAQARRGTCSRTNAEHPYFPEVYDMYKGNQAYINSTNPRLLYDLAKDGQKPPFLLLDCSDSRVNEQGIFSAPPGTLFTAGNIANQFDEADVSANSVLTYAVESLKVKHVVVMGHYGCGGVAASMMPASNSTRPSDIALGTWITPIRKIYEESVRPEIVAHRQAAKTKRAPGDAPDLHDPAFRAMVEENVKASVNRIAQSFVIRDHYTSLAQSEIVDSPASDITDVYVHGWVYDVENGVVSDLGVTTGPPGQPIPPSPFPMVKPAQK